jgi:hypothetical protein
MEYHEVEGYSIYWDSDTGYFNVCSGSEVVSQRPTFEEARESASLLYNKIERFESSNIFR